MTGSSAKEVIEHRLAEALLVEPISNALATRPVELSLTYCEPTPNTALRLDLESPSAMGRLVWWSDGSAEVEALRMSDGLPLLTASLVAPSSEQALGVLKVLVSVVGNMSVDC